MAKIRSVDQRRRDVVKHAIENPDQDPLSFTQAIAASVRQSPFSPSSNRATLLTTVLSDLCKLKCALCFTLIEGLDGSGKAH